MKFSINTTIVSLAALISISSSMSGGASPVTDDNRSNSIISSSVSRAAFQHQIIQLSENKKRILQGNTTCEQAYSDLRNSTNEVYMLYVSNYMAMLSGVDLGNTSSCNVSGNDMACDYCQSKSIAGQDEFELACTDLGAKVISFDNSENCDVTLDGDVTSWGMQFTAFVECAPVDCEEEIRAMTGPPSLHTSLIIFHNESSSVNANNVDCDVGSGTASVGSKTMLSVLITAVLSIILSAL